MKVLLVDGSAIAYRSFFAFARNPLRTSQGEETSLTYGFLTTLIRWLERFEPDAVSIVFDAPGRTFRHELDSTYKANRPPRPEGIGQQMPRLLQALETLRLQVLELAGFEADDVIGTLARRFESDGDLVYVASGDKDFWQLVSERVRLVRPSRGSGRDDEMGVEDLRSEFGLEPSQIVDWMALCGDTTDNVPGVAGVGGKTAAGLIRQHGSLDALYANLESVERESLRKRLVLGRSSAFRSRDLVRIETQAPVEVERSKLRWPGPDWDAFRALLVELEFFQILRQLPGPKPVVVARVVERTVVEKQEALASLATLLLQSPRFGVHVEWTEIEGEGTEIQSVSFALEPGRVFRVPFAGSTPPAPPGELDLRQPARSGFEREVLEHHLGPVFGSSTSLKIGHDLKRAALVLADHGLGLEGPFFDTLVASYLLNPGRKPGGLDPLAYEYLGEPPGSSSAKAGSSAEWVLRLYERLVKLLETDGIETLMRCVEMPLLGVLLDMERTGIRVDVGRLETLSHEMGDRIEVLEESIYTRCGHRFNLQSPKQLGEVLFGELGLAHGRRTQKGWATDVEVLERLATEDELGGLLLEYRKLTKLRSTYTDALPKLLHPRTGRIHTRFNQAVAATGRLSSSDPNLQNIPIRTDLGRRIRAAFVPESSGWQLLSADYSQIELRLMAHFSGDDALVEAFRDGEDVHAQTAARIRGCRVEEVTPEERGRAKTIQFGILYGMGPRGLADRLHISTQDARRFIDEYFESHPGVRRCLDEMVERARTQGFATTLLGRRLQFPDFQSASPAQRALAERVAVNAPIQGSAADLIKKAMVRVHTRIGRDALRARLLLQVHDELVLEMPGSETDALSRLVRQEMQEAAELRVPLVVDVGIGPSWAEAH